MAKGQLIFISGGVRSGKSSFAESMANKLANEHELHLHYIACGVPSDDEMRERIERHQRDREAVDRPWLTWEQGTEIMRIAHHFTHGDLVLLDCVTTLVNNYLFYGENHEPSNVIELVLQDFARLWEHAETVILVSNEVNHDIPYVDKLTLNYQYILGKIHQHIVAKADQAILVENGIPLYKKEA